MCWAWTPVWPLQVYGHNRAFMAPIMSLLREPRLARPLASHSGLKLPPLVLPKGQEFRVSTSTGAAYVVATGPDGVRSTQWIDAAVPPGSTFAGV